MASTPLSTRLQALSDSYKSTLELIRRLQKLPVDLGTFTSEAEARTELTSEIHQALREQEDALEILQTEVEDENTAVSSGVGRWAVGGGSVLRRSDSEWEQERERNAAMLARLGEDLRAARASFRQAQLLAKRAADTARRKEREALFSHRSNDPTAATTTQPPARRKGQEKLTQDKLALNASDDVTAALRRTHDLMQSNLEQSQFAQQTLDESTAALTTLGESYAGLGDLLKNSRGLVGQLLRSQKSDTWYLETAFYILVATIAWLVFRRIIYGPAWWLVWLPLKWAWWLFTVMLESVGVVGGGAVVATSSALSKGGRPTFEPGRPTPSVVLPAKGGGCDRPREPPRREDGEGLVESVGKMAEKAQRGEWPSVEGGELGEGERPNTKKRMFEARVTGDEL